jgi:hypothetical protein
MKIIDDVIDGREILQIDHSRDGSQMRVVVMQPGVGALAGREESLVFQRAGGDWQLVHRGPAAVDFDAAYGAFRRF